MRRENAICLILVLFTLILYTPLWQCGFVNYDDPQYVTENHHVLTGLKEENIKWAFSGSHFGNLDPLDWISHMAVCEFFDENPAAHHGLNLFLHLANTALLFLGLCRLTNRPWASLAAAAIFAWHPLQIETVVWISERKGVLSSFFWLLTTWAYLRYVEMPSRTRYAAMAFLFLLGLMCKPMLMTLPFALILLDFWPLKRWRWPTTENEKSALIAVIREKVPLFALAVIWIFVAFAAQRQAGALSMAEIIPFPARIGNALVSYWRYLGKFIGPTDLAVFYPHPGTWAAWEIVLSALGLAGVSAVVFHQREQRPYLLFGWCWFLGTMVPVIQLIQIGGHAMADRYFYIPGIGITIMLVWFLADIFPDQWKRNRISLLVWIPIVGGYLVLQQRQLSYWKDSESLFVHALAVTRNNSVAHNNLGSVMLDQNRLPEAIAHYREAIRIIQSFAQNGGASPNHTGNDVRLGEAYSNLGSALAAQGNLAEAITNYLASIALNSKDAQAHFNYGAALEMQGRGEAAVKEYSQAIELQPDYFKAQNNLGALLASAGRPDEAIQHYRAALAINPNSPTTFNNLGLALFGLGKPDEAVEQYQQALRLKPGYVEVRYNLGSAFAAMGRWNEAAEEYSQVLRASPASARVHYRYGLALAALGKNSEAIAQLREAVRLKPDQIDALNLLARLLAASTQPAEISEAVGLAEQAAAMTKKQVAGVLDTLAFAYAAAKRYPEATTTAEKALDLANKSGQAPLAGKIKKDIEFFRQGKMPPLAR